MSPMSREEALPADLFVVLGGQGTLCHLAPANGFPPQVYTPLVTALADVGRFIALVPLAMRAVIPPPRKLTWHMLAEEMANHLQAYGLQQVVAIGHSLGGVMSLLAAARYPSLFRALVLMDPVILPPATLWMLRWLRRVGLEGRSALVRAARRRRRVFPNREAARERYRRHPFFAAWHPQAFEAYVHYGLRERADGSVELAYSPDWEARVFATVPIDIWQWILRVRLPTLVVYGARSDTFRRSAARRLQRVWPHARFVALADAGHMFPLEEPERAARAIRPFLAEVGTAFSDPEDGSPQHKKGGAL